MRDYFYGSTLTGELSPARLTVPINGLRIYRRAADADGAGVVFLEVNQTSEALQGRVLAVVHAETAEELPGANVAGFVVVYVAQPSPPPHPVAHPTHPPPASASTWTLAPAQLSC